MATKRFNYLGDFSLDNTKVGIGTSNASETLEVIGGTTGKTLVVSGIATLSSYSGFNRNKTSYTGDVVIDSGESGTLSGEVVVGSGQTMIVSTGATTGQGSVNSLKVYTTFIPPVGFTTDRPIAPQPGSLFYNRDFRTIEFWDGAFWRQVDNTTQRGRGFSMGGLQIGSVFYSNIDYINIASKGNGVSFGTLHQKLEGSMGCGNETRGLSGGGNTPSDLTQIDYFAMASSGNAIDFGDLTDARLRGSGLASSTRGIFAGGRDPGSLNVIDYVEIATVGDAIDFGDLVTATRGEAAASSPTRGIFANGMHLGAEISYITIASKGNAIDFGRDKYAGGYTFNGGSTGVRAIWAGGYSGTGSTPYGVEMQTNAIRGVIIASGGNSTDFGELNRSTGFTYLPGLSNKTRACWCGGYVASPTPYLNTIDYFQMNTYGRAEDFGDLSYRTAINTTCSDSHGGLGGS